MNVIHHLAPIMRCQLNSTDIGGYTLLHCAAQGGHPEVVQLLIDRYKLDPTARDVVSVY